MAFSIIVAPLQGKMTLAYFEWLVGTPATGCGCWLKVFPELRFLGFDSLFRLRFLGFGSAIRFVNGIYIKFIYLKT